MEIGWTKEEDRKGIFCYITLWRWSFAWVPRDCDVTLVVLETVVRGLSASWRLGSPVCCLASHCLTPSWNKYLYVYFSQNNHVFLVRSDYKIRSKRNIIRQSLQKCYCFTVHFNSLNDTHQLMNFQYNNTRVGTLIVAIIYLQLIQNRYIFRSFTVLQCSHQHCLQPVASDVEVVGYL